MSENNDTQTPARKPDKIFPIIDDAKSLERMIDWGYSGALLMAAILLFDIVFIFLLSSEIDFSDVDDLWLLGITCGLIVICLILGHLVKSRQNTISAIILLLVWMIFGQHLITAFLGLFQGIFPGLLRPIATISALYLLINGLRACFAAPRIKALPDATVFD